ncbi:MAG: biotin-dependent carboxyltransferase family protein [Actinomycetota bacterium]|nr:biotin-dependent carboxyltransferase family protein [Actinomycetota bacterium]MDQ2956204.1 biotin-dependent carboxyltransferase family protein [Actinomycetota bacterium]
MIEVLTPGPLATMQDLGRTGYLELGVGRAGAADRYAHRLANRLAGNVESAATIEITLGGLAIRLLDAATIALTGARCDGASGWNTALSLAAGSTVRLGPPATGLRSYLAVRGGFAVTSVLGSRSSDTLSGLGPPPLRAGDRLPVGDQVIGPPSDEAISRPVSRPGIRVVPGPRADWFSDPAGLFDQSWSVLPASNRIGIRLDGSPLHRARGGELPSEPTLPGAIQVPPDGRPIVLGPDAPVTGGYPVIAVVFSADLDLLGQLRPGSQVRFTVLGG